jgi:hypothetical protein
VLVVDGVELVALDEIQQVGKLEGNGSAWLQRESLRVRG